MIDIHTHILPGIDDGSKKLDISLEMIKKSINEGTRDIVMTPHYRKGYFHTTYDEVKNITNELNKFIKSEGFDCNLHYGQEVYYSDKIIEDLDAGLIGTINGGRYMLVEFPMRVIPTESVDFMYELRLKGITPIIAHPERYHEVIRDATILNDFIDEGCLFQLNAGSILGFFGKDVKKCAEKLCKNSLYSFIGSDAHNNQSRNTGIMEGINEVKKINSRLYKEILVNSKTLIKNDEVIFGGEKFKKKKGFFLRK
ncbi:MAG: tyrosine-protein phosphatase [Clostridium sp.]|uniref:tyrosine-protein phosphatase n=1 Tax=Clostridium sp. TaxID=1506 RepID=UPI003F3A8E8E